MTSERSVSLKVTEVAVLSWALSALSLAGVPCGLHGHSLPHLRTNLGSEQESMLKFKASKSLLETIPGLSLCFSCIMLPWFTSHTVSSHHKALSIGGFRGKSVNKGMTVGTMTRRSRKRANDDYLKTFPPKELLSSCHLPA